MKDVDFNWSIIGHKRILNFLEKSIKFQNLSHAYLFYGTGGLGKHSLATKFIQILQCENDKKLPCGQCSMCQQVQKGIHPDVYFLKKEEDKKNISIEQVRVLQRKLSMRSFAGSFKIALINEAEVLSREAWDSLLKTLEEPTPRTIIILITNSINVLPKTILSRSQLLRFLPAPSSQIIDYLTHNLGIEPGQAEMLAQISLGKPGLAINFLQNPGLLENYQKSINDFLGILNSDMNQRMTSIDRLIPGDYKFLNKIELLQNTLFVWKLVVRDLLLLKTSPASITNVNLGDKLKDISTNYSSTKLKNILKNILKTQELLGLNVSPKLALNNLVLNI
ncbi:DNA polymerase III subunit [Patescibacteria group bacterium]|nr:DNA polymerase III subunit [Patescibacteria group bacterium]MBU4512904.1 DNA polymerase III subunit [Patescibacteria group bacterium]